MTEIYKLKIEGEDSPGIERIESYLKSVYRYIKMLDMEAPDLLIDTEKTILSSRLEEMNHEEVVMSYLMWPGFCEEQVVRDALIDEQIEIEMANSPPS